MASKKVDALEERLEGEVGSLKSNLDEKFSSIEGRFSSLEGRFGNIEDMLKKLVEVQIHPPNPMEKGKSPNPSPIFPNGDEGDGSHIGAGHAGADVAGQGVSTHGMAGYVTTGPRRGAAAHEATGMGPWGGGVAGPRGGGYGREKGVWRGKGSSGPGTWGEGGEHWQGAWEGDDVMGGWGRYPGQGEGYGARTGEHGEPPMGEHRARPWEGRYHNGGMGEGRGQWRGDAGLRKLKMPIFEGEDAYGWIYKVERYFSFNGLTPEEKLHAAPLCLEGRALAWYQWLEGRQPVRCWEEFRDLLLDRFRASREGNYHEQFFALVQEGTVREYREKFELLSGRLRGMTDDVMEGNFMKGLKPHIRAALRVSRPRGLVETMEVAQLIEDQRAMEQMRRPNTVGTNFRGANPTGGVRMLLRDLHRKLPRTKMPPYRSKAILRS